MEEFSESVAPADREPDRPTQVPDSAGADARADSDAAATVEAILFASDSALTAAKISMAAELPAKQVKQAIDQLNTRYEQSDSAIAIEEIAGGYQMLTRPQYNDVLQRLLRARSDSKLSQAAMEALAIVAYRQPIMRADIEAIRGVASGEVLRGLLEKNLVKIVGRAEVLGRPMLYGTTRRFLEVFGLASLDDLPRVEELRTAASQASLTPQPPTVPPQDQPGPEDDTSDLDDEDSDEEDDFDEDDEEEEEEEEDD